MQSNFYGVQFGGLCPVQAEGYTLDGKWYYFRARGTQVSLEIAETEQEWVNDRYLYSQYWSYGFTYEAGYIPYEDALPLFNEGMDNYLKSVLL